MQLSGDIVFTSGAVGDTDIWRLDLETRALTQLTTGNDMNEQPRWSPSGSRIAFISNRDKGIPKLFIMGANGGQVTQLTKGDHFCDGVSWFPDGQRILFSGNLQQSDEIDLFSIDTRNQQPPLKVMTGEGIESGPCVSPDGSHILYCVASESEEPGLPRNYDIWEYHIQSGRRNRMTDHLLRDFSARYAPDGHRIAFISQRTPGDEEELTKAFAHLQHLVLTSAPIREIDNAIRAVQGLERRADLWLLDRHQPKLAYPLTSGRLVSASFTWSPDGRYICYAAAEPESDGVTRLHVVDVKTGESEPLEFDRTPLMVELKTDDARLLSRTGLGWLIPDFLQRRMVPRVVHGSEYQPDWRGEAG